MSTRLPSLYRLLAIFVSLTFLLTGCVVQPAAPSSDTNIPVQGEPATVSTTDAKIIKIANFYAPTHPVNVALRETFKPQLEELTNGRYEVQIYDSSSLGAERELTEGVRLGTIEMGIAGGLLSETYPRLKVLELPFMFDDYAHVWRVLDSPLGEEFAADFADANLTVLAWIGNGFRVFSNSVRPIETLADTQGIKMRMPENKIYIDTAEALGFNVVTMPFSEIFTALSTKVVDGQDNPLATLVASNFYEVQQHVAISNHIFSYGSIVVNTDFWNTLPAEDQDILRQVAIETAAQERRLLEESTNDLIKTVEEAGLQITYPDIAEFRAATEKVRSEFASGYEWAPELIEAILAEAGAK